MDLRILSFNIHKGVGWLSRKSTMPIISSTLAAHDPDIIFLQEIRSSQFDMLCSEYWSNACYGKNAVYLTEHHGNAILSKFPIEFVQNLDLTMHRFETRGLLHSIIKINDKQIDLLCVHLGLFEKDRRTQLAKIIEYMNLTINENSPIILAGDFNDWSNYSTKPLKQELLVQETFSAINGKSARTYPSWAPIFRLDRIYVRGFKPMQVSSLQKKPWRFLSDHLAIEAVIQTE